MGPQPLFGWIHLSDIHIGHGGVTHVEDQKLVLDALRRDVERMLENGAPPPDAILVTGDIAFSGACLAQDEYTRAARWLAEIAKSARLGLDAVFVVPGNHDVQRPVDKPVMAQMVLRQLREGKTSLDEVLAEPEASARLRARQENYLTFAADLAPACRTDAETPGAKLYWRHTLLARSGLRVRIVGLNTALLAADEKIFESDQGRLRLGIRQLAAAFIEPAVERDEVVIVLSHHPLHDHWLADETEAASWIRSYAHLHLTGHVHEASSKRARGGSGTDFVSISAGAVHGEKLPHGSPAQHGYSFGALIPGDQRALKVRVWPRKWSDRNKDFRLDGDNVSNEEKYAEHDLPRVRLPAGRSSASPGSGLGRVPTPAIAEPAKISIAHLPAGTEYFVGRTDELRALDQAWSDHDTHVMTILAWGGTGKSALVAEWLARMSQAQWRGAVRVFGWSFYSQGVRDDGVASADRFVNEALKFFGDADPTKGSAWERGERLAELVRMQRTLLVLDGLEPLQEPETSGGRLREQALMALLRQLAAGMDGLCIITTRQPVGEIAEFAGKTAVRVNLEQLSEHDGAELLLLCGSKGPEEERREVSRAVKGHALTVVLLGNYIADALDGDVRRWREVPLGMAEIRPGEHAQHVMKAYDRWFGQSPERAILRLIGLFDRPADMRCIATLRERPAIAGMTEELVVLTEVRWRLAVSRLRRAGLLVTAGEIDNGSLDAHPLVRACFGEMLARENPEGGRTAHGRLYTYLRRTTPERPDTLEGLQPLYQAVWHGCRAGQHQEVFYGVFYARIQRDTEHYSALKLGAFGSDLAALAGFFEGDWTRPATSLTEDAQAWVLAEAAFALHALGRSREAVTPMKLSLDMNKESSNWMNAAPVASELAALHASLGALRDALSMAGRAMEFAERSGNAEQQIFSRASRATILHKLGHREDARKLFKEVERMQVARGPKSPFVHGPIEHYFCDLLLDLGEAWEVERRARKTLAWAEESHALLSIALDHLSLGCAMWSLEQRESARSHLTLAIDGLRAARQQEFLASALVLRVAFLREANHREAARRDLDEALGLARRSELRLVECDAYLEQARLALDEDDPATARAAFDAARSLVDECEYHRRDCELALLEARLALTAGDRAAARAAYERAREIATAEKLRACDKELSEIAAAVA